MAATTLNQATEAAGQSQPQQRTCPTCGQMQGVLMVLSGGTHKPFLICTNADCPNDLRVRMEAN